MQLLPEVLEGSRQKKIGKKQESCAGSMSSILLISYFSAFDPDHIEKLMFYSFFILVRVQLNTSQFAFFASLLIKQLNAFLNSFQCEIFVSYLSLVVPFILLLHSSRKQRTFLGILLILVLTFQIFLQIRVFLQYKAYLMQGEQISPWSMYKQKPGHTPFKFQHKILKKVQKNKIALPQIDSSLQAIQMNVKKKLDLQQSSMLKRENNKNSTAMTSIHKIIQGKRKLDDEKLKNAAEQNFKVKRIDQEKVSFQNQINSLLVFKMLYQQLKNQEENYHQKIQLKEEPVQMIKKPVQMIKSGSQALSNQKKAKNNELFAEVKCNRIHKLIQNISQDKLKEVLITQKISQRLRIIWQSKRKGHSTNK